MQVSEATNVGRDRIAGGCEVLVIGGDEAVGDCFEGGLVVVEAGEVVLGFAVGFEVASAYCVEAAVGLSAGETDVDAGTRGAVGGERACGVVGVALCGVAGERVGVGEPSVDAGAELSSEEVDGDADGSAVLEVDDDPGSWSVWVDSDDGSAVPLRR